MDQVLAALGNADRISIIEVLLARGPQSQVQLCAVLGEEVGTMSKRIHVLLAAGIVARDRPRGDCYLPDPDATRRLLQSAALLELAIAEARAAKARDAAERLRRLHLRPVSDQESA
jgi:DNA-binding MarR family transcriptional regulator